MKTALSALMGSKSTNDFLKSYLANESFVIHGLKEDIKELTALPFLDSLEALLNSWPGVIQAHLPDVKDEASSIDTNPRDAQKLFENGMGLLFNHAESISPLLQKWLYQLRKDIGLSALTDSRCLIYATPKGGGTAPHFDQNINFVLQISGSKNWWITPNDDVANPLTRHTMGQPVDPELGSYLEAPLPVSMPKNVSPIMLKAGSLLFVPRGSWHWTEAESDALSLNFTFSAPSWIDLFTAALRGRLAQSPDWRETANGVSDPIRLAIAEEKLDFLLQDLINDLPNWRASDILNATEYEN